MKEFIYTIHKINLKIDAWIIKKKIALVKKQIEFIKGLGNSKFIPLRIKHIIITKWLNTKIKNI